MFTAYLMTAETDSKNKKGEREFSSHPPLLEQLFLTLHYPRH
jgi:hypothetical protein